MQKNANKQGFIGTTLGKFIFLAIKLSKAG